MLATPASFTRPQLYQAAADAISAFDLYFFRLIEVSLAYGDVFGEYGATLPQSIDDRFWRLPFHVDGLDIKFTNHQLDEAARALRGIDAGIDANVKHLDNVETGIYVGAAIGAGIAFAPAVIWFAGTSAGAALGGALAEAAPWLLLHGAWNAASNRVADGQGDVDVIEGTLADMTGWTSLNMGVYQIDPVTGQPFALTPGQRAVNIVGGSVQLVLVVAGVTAAGRAVQQEFQIASNQFPPPGGLSVSTPGIGGGLALEGTLGATATGTSGGAIAGTLGATRPLVVYMTRAQRGSGEQPGWLEGKKEHIVRNPETGDEITDIDHVQNGVLWEEKSVTSVPDTQKWITENIFDKFEKYMRARRELPHYEAAPIGFRFTGGPLDINLRNEIHAAITRLRSENSGVEILVEGLFQ